MYSVYGFASFDHYIREYLGSSIGIPYNIASDRLIDIRAKKRQQCDYTYGIFWFYYVLYYLEAAGLKEH